MMKSEETPVVPYGTLVRVWASLVALTALLTVVSRASHRLAVAGMLTITPLKAALVMACFMQVKDEKPAIKIMVITTLGTLVIFLALLFSDVWFRTP